MNIYSYGFNCICPNDSNIIYYTIKIKSQKMIMIERIKKHCGKYKKQYHEAIADDLFKKFGGKQTVTATHKNVKIKTVRK